MRIVEYAELVKRVPVAERFVYSAFCQGSGVPDSVLTGLLERGARAVVAVGNDDDTFYGFAIASGNVVVWAYVKSLRIPQDDGSEFRLRGKGICKALLAELGFDKKGHVPVMFDSPAAKRFANNGWDITVMGAPAPMNYTLAGRDQ